MLRIDEKLVKKLIKNQFPEYDCLPIRQVEKSGHDNRTFRLGDKTTVRLPSRKEYSPQVEKELFWLPKLKQYLSLPIPTPLAKGQPMSDYPFPWSINQWIEGDVANYKNITDLNQFAADLAKFLKELQAIDASNGPSPGKHNFYRGGELSFYHEEVWTALKELKSVLPTDKLNNIWQAALGSKWTKENVWVHGDIAVGNLLVKSGKLCGIIDFGMLGIGDPSCDYAIAWTFFDKESRKIFFEKMRCDKNTWNRARGWALWKALITYSQKDLEENAKYTISAILEEENLIYE